MLSRFGRSWKIDPIGNSGDAVACGRGGRMCDAPDPIIVAAVITAIPWHGLPGAMLRTPVLRLGRDSDYPDGRYSIVSYADAPCDGMRVVAPAMDDSSSSEGGNNATTTSTTVTPLDGSVTLPEAADAAAAAFLESSYTSW
jgi:hypothetical protein